MVVPPVEQPQRYSGLYIFDFGEWSAVGYTAEEIAILLESEQYADGKVYQIVRASPDGTMELRGVAASRFRVESGMFFWRHELGAAREDFDALIAIAEDAPPPGKCYVHLTDFGDGGAYRYLVALVYPGEHEEAMGRWLLERGYAGGDVVEGGPSHVRNYQEADKKILDRRQVWSAAAERARSAEEVFASVRRAVQR